ncbi:hypothetical protein NDU88_003515 [Pleurodeles waltl]|uniref:Uncharacterized protein n=1 Tax=Pleurodeles waltl TaxID=8319 RepID=A0AAV7V099_PLEWA|nr:hypothetical protein NDU88_003515 [Pleurodeles waltl]
MNSGKPYGIMKPEGSPHGVDALEKVAYMTYRNATGLVPGNSRRVGVDFFGKVKGGVVETGAAPGPLEQLVGGDRSERPQLAPR